MFGVMFSLVICCSFSAFIMTVVDNIPATEMVGDTKSDGDGKEENETDQDKDED